MPILHWLTVLLTVTLTLTLTLIVSSKQDVWISNNNNNTNNPDIFTQRKLETIGRKMRCKLQSIIVFQKCLQSLGERRNRQLEC